jgi:multiple sugar transport system substrate-binding protein
MRLRSLVRLSCFVGSLALLAQLVLPAAAAAQQPVTITYYTFSAAPDHLKDLDQAIAAFHAVHPEINVEVQTAPFNDYFTKLQTLIAGGTAPDVFELNYENFVSYAANGTLSDLGTLAAADPSYDPSIFYPRARDAFALNGAQYALPATFSTVVLFYNQDLFDRAGLSYPSADWTWFDEITAAQTLTDKSKGVWGDFEPIQFWEFYKVIAQNGGSFFSPDRSTVTLNTAQNIYALKFLQDKIQRYHVTPTDAEMGGVSDGDMFKGGKLAMLRTGIWMFPSFKDAPFKWDIQLEPGNTQKAHHFFSNAVGVSATSPSQRAAWEWVKFFTSSSDVAQLRVNSGWELPALNSQDFFQEYLTQRPPANRQVVFDALNSAVVPPVVERQSELQDTMNTLLEKVKLNQLTPEAALGQAQTAVARLLGMSG